MRENTARVDREKCDYFAVVRSYVSHNCIFSRILRFVKFIKKIEKWKKEKKEEKIPCPFSFCIPASDIIMA
ncbi:hypothetical protein WN944_012944 [Citrus x changshan-huyou]|uniref:Uncharacterized protein n=1 Tax=Citrus x changshan-huyou TaxID=2935761 RepID=A0AAP0M2Z4_9ROSI